MDGEGGETTKYTAQMCNPLFSVPFKFSVINYYVTRINNVVTMNMAINKTKHW